MFQIIMQSVLIFSIFMNFQNIQIQIFKRKFLIMFWHGQKKKVKQKSPIKLQQVKPFNLFISGSGGVRKLHLIKTIDKSVSSKVTAIPW